MWSTLLGDTEHGVPWVYGLRGAALDEAARAEGGGGHRRFGGDGFNHNVRAAALQSVREAARDLSVALREQKAARERAARARRVRGEQRVRV